MSALFISAAHKSSGKTMVSVGLTAAFTARGLKVQPFKKGPDYIDPMWLARASGRPCYNLDFNTQDDDEILATFARHAMEADLSLIEGNKGLHDGVSLDGADSSAALARRLGAPVVLVVDTLGMARGVAPLLAGYKAFDPQVNIAGVILNKVGASRQETKLRQAIERYTDIAVLGAIGRDEGPRVEERHLGLTTPLECPALTETIARLRAAVERGVDLDRLQTIARSAPAPVAKITVETRAKPDVRIAIARDEAFGFYYADDLEALERAGAELVYFDAIRDRQLPACDGLFIGGGFPETSAARLSGNSALRMQIKDALRAGLPCYAECGGLMYLTRSIEWDGKRHEMVGVVPADTRMEKRPQGRGLVKLEETDAAPWGRVDNEIRAHEFHHGALYNIEPTSRFAYRVRRGHGVDGVHDGFVVGNLLASFTHLRDTQAHHWAQRFVSFVRNVKQQRGNSAATPLFSPPPASSVDATPMPAPSTSGDHAAARSGGALPALPIALNVSAQWGIVVGGNIDAARHAEMLLRAGAAVTVFSSSLCSEFVALRERFSFEHVARLPARRAELEGVAICAIALDDVQAQERVRALAKQAGALVNVAGNPALCDFTFPSIIDRAPLMIAIASGGASPLLTRILRARIESTIPAHYGKLAEFVRAHRADVVAHIDDGRARLRFWERVLEGPIAELVLAGDADRAASALVDELRSSTRGDDRICGEVYLVGAGPGDPDLLSFRALRLMQKADVVLYDNLVESAIVDLVRRDAERIYVGKRSGDHALPQEEIVDLLVRLAQQGKRVLRLKGGDPFIFGRGGEEIEKLAENRIPFQVCPGVTAAIGCAAYAGIPLTHRDHAQSVVFVTAHGKNGPLDLDWSALAKPGQTAAVYMGLSRIEKLMHEFEAHGADPDTPAAIVDNGTRPNQRVVAGTVRTLAEKARAAQLRGPTIVIVGSVVTLRDRLDWYNSTKSQN
ncbi:MAG: cobyrinate a,c-diamide synthase [Hyphomicrobiales bacterium]|nr:cobyrinate a,c-diamide synthase [Hyphomicrobiales bacterium]